MGDEREKSRTAQQQQRKERQPTGHKSCGDGTGTTFRDERPVSAVVIRRPALLKVLEFDVDGNLVSKELVDTALVQPPVGCGNLLRDETRPTGAAAGRDSARSDHTAGAPRPPTDAAFLTLPEAARYCRCRKTRLLSWERRGLVTSAVDADGRRFFRRTDLDQLMTCGPEPATSNTSERKEPPRTPKRRELPALPYTEPRTTRR